MNEKQPEPTTEELSNCHKAKVRVAGEATNYYVCELCQEPCDLWQEDEPNLDNEKNGFYGMTIVRSPDLPKGDDK